MRIAGPVRPVLPRGPVARELPVARDVRVPGRDPAAGRRRPSGRARRAHAVAVPTRAAAAAVAVVLSVRLRHLRTGPPGPCHVAVRSHVLPEVHRRGRGRLRQAVRVPQVRPVDAVSAARQRAGQVAGRETVAGAVAGVRTAGRGQRLIQTGQAPLGPAQVQPGVLHGYVTVLVFINAGVIEWLTNAR